MRYFVLFSPTNTVRTIDTDQDLCVNDVLDMVKKDFGLHFEPPGPQERVLVLNFDGCDLKPKWKLKEIPIPTGSILRCLFRRCPTPYLHVHCSYSRKILKFFESAVNLQMTVGDVRIRISNELGIPLSLFRLESFDGNRHFYDEAKLIDYNLQVYDHVFLKVWSDQEKFLNSCLKGFAEHFSNDELVRHYQAQVALHIAAFYGHIELAKYALQIGGRADRPTGEHPARQWLSSETERQTLLHAFKCPIHIAIERGHYKMVHFFVEQSIFCTQIADPVSRFLPYRLALFHGFNATKHEEKQQFNEIYFYLFAKQYYVRIPINSTAKHVETILSRTGDSKLMKRDLASYKTVSLSFYCRIIRWAERARQKAWARITHKSSNAPSKKVYPEHGLLGYPVLIDGINNDFDGPVDQSRIARANSTDPTEHTCQYGNFSNEDRMRIYMTKRRIKNFLTNDRPRQQQPMSMLNRRATIVGTQRMSITNQSSTLKSALKQSSFLAKIAESLRETENIEPVAKPIKVNVDEEQSMPTGLPNSPPFRNRVRMSMPAIHRVSLSSDNLFRSQSQQKTTTIENQYPILSSKPMSSSKTNNRDTVSDEQRKTNQKFRPRLSAADIYFLNTSKLNPEEEKRKSLEKIERMVSEQANSIISQSSSSSSSVDTKFLRTVDPQLLLEKESRLLLRDGKLASGPRPIKSRFDQHIHRQTMKSYQTRSDTSSRDTVVECIEEAAHFKGKSWLRQIEISKQMIKTQAQQKLRQTTAGPLRASSSITITRTRPIEVR